MRNILWPLAALALASVTTIATPAQAQATRTWVSGVGDDANPCSRTAPCKTFAGAISKTAAFGEINCLDPGGFGALTITKSITIDCESTLGGILAAGTNGITVNVPAATDVVTLRGLDLEGAASGINGVNFIGSGTLHVRNVRIHAFRNGGSGINFAPVSGGELYVTDSVISDSGNNTATGGVNIKPSATGSANAHMSRVRLENNSVGLIADGTLGTTGVNVNMQESLISGNANNGISAISNATHAPVTVSIIASMISGNFGAGLNANGVAISGPGSAIVRVGSSMITANVTGVSSTGSGQVLSYSNNQVNANGGGETFNGNIGLK